MLGILRIIFSFIAPYALKYGSTAIELFSGLSLKQIGYVVLVVAFIGQDVYVYNLGISSEKAAINKQEVERQKKYEKIKNSVNSMSNHELDSRLSKWLLKE